MILSKILHTVFCFSHLLVVFGGLQGLEASLESDESMKVDDVSEVFDLYLNTCPQQGSRTIRTEVQTLEFWEYSEFLSIHHSLFSKSIGD